MTIAMAPIRCFPAIFLSSGSPSIARRCCVVKSQNGSGPASREECQKARVDILQGHIALDHVHVMISIPPHVTIRRLSQRMQGTSSYRLLVEFPPSSALQRWGPYERTGLAEPLLVSCQRCRDE